MRPKQANVRRDGRVTDLDTQVFPINVLQKKNKIWSKNKVGVGDTSSTHGYLVGNFPHQLSVVVSIAFLFPAIISEMSRPVFSANTLTHVR